MLNRRAVDSLAAMIGSLGDPGRDKLASAYYFSRFLAPNDLLEIYRGSWLARKIVNIPAFDAVRAWRDYKAEQDQIEAIEAEEKRLGLVQKVLAARVKARLFGGGGVYIGTGQSREQLEQPLDPGSITKGGIKYLTALTSNELRVGEIDFDPISPYYGKAKYYQVGGSFTANMVTIHPSRVVAFYGVENVEPRFGLPGVAAYGWGDSILQTVFDAISHADSAVANIASLIFEANVDVFGVPDLLAQVADPEYQVQFKERMMLAAMNKSINRSLIMDAAETFNRKTISFSGLDSLIDKFMLFVSGAADMPATRLFGQSPAGMSSTGESDMRNYYDAINAGQKIEMQPALDVLDECLYRSAMGSRNPSIFYSWAPLWQLTAKEQAEIGKSNADTAATLANLNIMPSEALAGAVVNQLTESGFYPGLDQAVAALPPVDFESLDNPEPEPVPGAVPTRTTDATPRSLYIYRKVKNSTAIRNWAKGQGIPEPMGSSDLHVTIAYSREPIDWMKLSESWSDEIKIAAGGPRVVEQFDGGAIVLSFACRELHWRHREVIEAGGSTGHPEYQPHITVSWYGDTFDVGKVEAYQGEIVLGPEIFQEIDDSWRERLDK
jgi:uncharacterized protein